MFALTQRKKTWAKAEEKILTIKRKKKSKTSDKQYKCKLKVN